MTYVPVTVGRRPGGFTVGRTRDAPFTVGHGPAVAFTVTGHPGSTASTGIDRALTTEAGGLLLTEAGGILLYA